MMYKKPILSKNIQNYNNKFKPKINPRSLIFKNKTQIKEINFSMRFTTGQSFKVKGNPSDTFKYILDKLIRENNLENFRSKIGLAIFEARKIEPNKTLSENQIKEGCIILIIIKNTDNNQNVTDKTLSDSVSTTASISDLLDFNDINEMILLSIYNKYINRLRNSQRIHLARSSKIKPCEGDGECTHVHTKKHEHGLVLLFSNRDWICDNCHSEFSKKEPTYYCSLCDFDICNECIGINKKYSLIDYYHQQTKLKNYKFPCHEHNLIYCRTSRSKNRNTTWICDLCYNNYENKIWSFYCTNCDYDICLSCSKQFISKDEFINKMSIKIDDHIHRLIYLVSNRNWICNLCRESYPNFIATYYCTKCDFDVCRHCMKELSDEVKYPLISKGKKENDSIKIIKNLKYHQHPLVYCITSRCSEAKTNWICDKCLKHYNNGEWSFYCSLCDFDLCFECYKSLH